MNITDAMREGLSGAGSINDKLLAFFQAGGATSGNIMVAEREYLIAQGVASGAISDMWNAYLRDHLNYYGSLEHMLRQFWLSQKFACYIVFKDTKQPTDLVGNQPMTLQEFAGPRVKSDGTIVFADEPVLDEEGLHTYGGFTNLIVYSEDLSGIGWSIASGVVSPNQEVAPDGSMTADLVYATQDYWNIRQAISATAGTEMTFSFFVKNNGSSDVKYSVYDDTNSVDIIAPTSYISEISDDEWNRVSVSFTVPVGCSQLRVYPIRDPGVSDCSVYIWGVQVTETPYPMPYCPTNTYYPVEDAVELVRNGGFDTDSDWTKGTGWSIENGIASCDGTQTVATSLRQDNILPAIGKVCRVSLSLLNCTAGQFRVLVGSSAATDWFSADGDYVQEVVVAGSDDLQIQADATFIGSIDNVSVIEVESYPTTVVNNYSDVDEGYKFQITPDEVGSLYTGPTVGGELLVDPYFETYDEAEWNYDETQISVGGGELVYTNATTGKNTTNKTASLTVGKVYEWTFIISEWTAGAMRLNPGSTGITSSYSQPGTYTERFIATGTSFMISSVGTPTTMTLSHSSLKEVSRNMGMPLLLDALDGNASENTEKAGPMEASDWRAYGSNTIVNNGEAIDITVVDNDQGGFSLLRTDGYQLLTSLVEGSRYEVRFQAKTTGTINAEIWLARENGVFIMQENLSNEYQEYICRFTATANSVTQSGITERNLEVGDVVSIKDLSVKEISPAQGEIVIEWIPKFDYDDTDIYGNILDWQENATRGLYHNYINGNIVVHDGTSSKVRGIHFQANILYTITITYGSSLLDLVITYGTTVEETLGEPFDGSFDPADFLAIAFLNSQHWNIIKSIKVYKEPQSW